MIKQVLIVGVLLSLLTAVCVRPLVAGENTGSSAALGPICASSQETALAPPFGIDPSLFRLNPEGAPQEEDLLMPLSAAKTDLDGFDIPVTLNDAVSRYIKYFSVTKHDLFAKWLTRTKAYAPVVTEILKKHGLPEDLVYLAMIESGFNLKAYSPMKAAGPWQFIHETGERYGLRVNYWVDERRDLEKSTVAAARYLKTLFDQFGGWHLAAAGYNAGEGRIGRAVAKHDTRDFWKLRSYNALPRETREYVPQILAAAIIAKDPKTFGFADVETAPYDPTRIRVPGGIALKGIARGCDLELADLKALNPEMLKNVTPPDRKEYLLKLPSSADPEDVSKKLQASLVNCKQLVGMIKHPLRKKETIATVLKRYKVENDDLALLNEEGDNIRPKKGGRVLYIPQFASLKASADTVRPVDDDSDDITELQTKKMGTQSHFLVQADTDDDSVAPPKQNRVHRKAPASDGGKPVLTRQPKKTTTIHKASGKNEKKLSKTGKRMVSLKKKR
jgi:membrane-bound lytic murein transglycosylase D